MGRTWLPQGRGGGKERGQAAFIATQATLLCPVAIFLTTVLWGPAMGSLGRDRPRLGKEQLPGKQLRPGRRAAAPPRCPAALRDLHPPVPSLPLGTSRPGRERGLEEGGLGLGGLEADCSRLFTSLHLPQAWSSPVSNGVISGSCLSGHSCQKAGRDTLPLICDQELLGPSEHVPHAVPPTGEGGGSWAQHRPRHLSSE